MSKSRQSQNTDHGNRLPLSNTNSITQCLCPWKNSGALFAVYVCPRNNDDGLKMKTIMHQN